MTPTQHAEILRRHVKQYGSDWWSPLPMICAALDAMAEIEAILRDDPGKPRLSELEREVGEGASPRLTSPKSTTVEG